MKKYLFVLLTIVLMVTSAFVVNLSGQASQNSNSPLLEFGNMVPVQGGYVGSSNPIRGINGGGKSWIITMGQGVLTANGNLQVHVKGLVLTETGTNPIPDFKAIVSCLSMDSSGNPTMVTVSTGNFPASNSGNAYIQAKVDLPAVCMAPMVFVTSPTGLWFAVNGK